MAIGASVPPRAYTREILTTAFNWLQTQPDAVRAKATTPDALVGLYMQATRGTVAKPEFGSDSDAPVSSQAFMSDLKNLAEGLREFDDSKANRAVAPPSSSKAQLSQPSTYPQPSATSRVSQPAQMPPHFPLSTPSPVAGPKPNSMHAVAMAAGALPATPPVTHVEMPSFDEAPAAASPSQAPTSPGFNDHALSLNTRSVAMLREVRQAMNLSNDFEALNMMIAVAYKNLKPVLP